MNESLRYFLRHNIWATRTILEVCETLDPEQLTAPAIATYGSIMETLNHLVTSDASYLWSLGGPQTAWVADAEQEKAQYAEPWNDDGPLEPVATLDDFSRRLDEIEGLWESFFASNEFDAEHVSVLDLGTYECPAGIVMAQVLHHGSVHREQVCAMLTHLGIEPPDVQPWAFADATGTSRFIGGRTS